MLVKCSGFRSRHGPMYSEESFSACSHSCDECPDRLRNEFMKTPVRPCASFTELLCCRLISIDHGHQITCSRVALTSAGPGRMFYDWTASAWGLEDWLRTRTEKQKRGPPRNTHCLNSFCSWWSYWQTDYDAEDDHGL